MKMSRKEIFKLQYLIHTHNITPQKDEPLSHFEAKCRVIEIGQAQGLKAYDEHCWGKHYFPLKGWRTYTSDILFEDPVLETRNFIVEIGEGGGDNSYHDSNYNVKQNKLGNRIKDLEWLTKKPVITFKVEELVGPYAMPDIWIREKLGLDIF